MSALSQSCEITQRHNDSGRVDVATIIATDPICEVELANVIECNGADKLDDGENTDKKNSLFSFLGFSKKDESEINAPVLPYIDLFRMFLWFGCRAFGGPVAQIQMMKQEIVSEQKWISEARFNRVYAVYQVLPGPEATELACYFGYLSRGRIGSLIGGLGFILPGLLGMLLWSYLYVNYGIQNDHVQASFMAVQNTVAAMIFRATYKLGEGALKDKHTKTFSWDRGFLFLFTFLTAVIRLNFFIALGVCGVMNSLFESNIKHKHNLAYLCAGSTIGFYILYVALEGVPSESMVGGADSTVSSTSLTSLFELGLIAGMVTFGGAYTTLPFIFSVAVQSGKWLEEGEFLDAIAITNMMPTPLVTFVTLVGWIGNGVGGALIMVLGIMLPAFSFTFIGHNFFEHLVDNKYVEPFLDGVSASVIGLLLMTAFQFVKGVVESGVDAVVFFLSFAVVFHFTDKYTQPLAIIVSAMAGQVLYS